MENYDDKYLMEWLKIEGAVLEQLLVYSPIDQPADRTNIDSLIEKARIRFGFSPSDISEYMLWRDKRSGSLRENLGHHGPRAWQLIRESADALLRYEGVHCLLKDHEDAPGIERLMWRWVSLCAPPLTLCAALAERGRIPAKKVQVLSRMMAPTSDVAILHVHYGQMLSFETIWNDLSTGFFEKGVFVDPKSRGQKRLRIRSASPPDPISKCINGREWERILSAAMFVRGVLARLVLRRQHVSPAAKRLAVSFGRGRAQTVPEIQWGLARHEARPPMRHDTTKYELEVVHEQELQAALFQKLRETLPEEPWWVNAFEKYLQVRSILYTHFVHRPWERGLASFQARAYNTDPYEKMTGSPRQLDIESEWEFGRIRTLEIRATASRWVKDRNRWNEDRKKKSKLGCCKPDNSPDQNWIISFNRFVNRKSRNRYADQKSGSFFAAHLDTWIEAKKHFELAKGVLTHDSHTLKQTRGLDIMGLEKKGPLWVVRPRLNHLRRISNRIAGRNPNAKLAPLYLTIHAGEDVDYILTGLRNISEPLLWGDLKRGDRLGHATPLGLDIDAWSKQNPHITTTWWDRFLDLGWVAHCHHELGLSYSDEFVRLHEEAQLCAKYIWSDDKHILCDAYDALHHARSIWEKLGEDNILGQFGYPYRRSDTASTKGEPWKKMLRSYLYDRRIFEKATSRTCHVDAWNDKSICIEIQAEIRKRLGGLQITIEAAPSSNLCVGGVQELFGQPFFYFRAPTDPAGEDTLPVAINSDDPLAFATCTEDEYGYAWAAMVVAGTAPSLATQRIEEIAQNSLRASFSQSRL